MFNSVANLLTLLGLNQKEIEVYKSCYQLGVGTVSQIAKNANLKRANTYNLLKSIYVQLTEIHRRNRNYRFARRK